MLAAAGIERRRLLIAGIFGAGSTVVGIVGLLTDGDIGLWLTALGDGGLLVWSFALQIREGILALRRDTHPLRPVAAVTIAFCAAVTLTLLLATVIGSLVWNDLRTMPAGWYYGVWISATGQAVAVVLGIEIVRRARRRGQASGATN